MTTGMREVSPRPTLRTPGRRRARGIPVGLLAALLAVGPGCGSEPESARSAEEFLGELSGGPDFRNMDPIGGPSRSATDATAAFMAYDANGDGALDETELSSNLQSLIARADTDADGTASEEEILALLTREEDESAEARETAENP